jgi:hypothetical protein
LFCVFLPFRKSYGRQNSLNLEDINLDQFLKISNYEETIKQLDIYYGIVKRQLLQNQSEITGLFPVMSTDKEVKSRGTSQVLINKSYLCRSAPYGTQHIALRLSGVFTRRTEESTTTVANLMSLVRAQ